jgi:phosphomannomutase
LIRASGTEPVFRLYAEAKDKEKALKLVEEYSSRLKELLQTI